MKSLIFASRNIKELLREPLSWVFCLGFPIVMLIVMTLINESIPPQAGMTIFRIDMLAPGIAIFGLAFIMLFACLLISGDRKDAFLLRIFTSPMKSSDYIIGYILPLIILSFGQSLITIIAALIIGVANDVSLNIGNMLFSIVTSIPTMILMIGFGIIFGTLFNKNAAPGLASIIITFSGMLGGIWMDIEAMGGTLKDICDALPFYHAVKSARAAYAGNFGTSLTESGIVLIWAAVIIIFSIIIFKKKMRY